MAIQTNDKYPIDMTKVNKIAGYSLENPFWATKTEGGTQLPGGKADQFLALKNTTSESPGIDDLEWRDVKAGEGVVPTEAPILKGKVLKTKKTVTTELTKDDLEWADDTGLTEEERATLNKVNPLSETVGSLLETVSDMQTETSGKFDDIDGDLSALSNRMGSAEQNIGENAKNIATNTSTISSNYTTLDTKIDTVKSDLDGDIDALKATTSQHTTDISSLQSTTSQHTTDISNLQTTVGKNTQNIETNANDIDGLETLTANHTQNIGNLQTAVDTNTTDISNLQTTVGTNTTDIGNLQTEVGNNTTSIGNLQNDVAAITPFSPSNDGKEGQLLTKTATGYEWADLIGDGWVYFGELVFAESTMNKIQFKRYQFKTTITVTDNNSNVTNYNYVFDNTRVDINKETPNCLLHFQAYNGTNVNVEFKMLQKYNDTYKARVWYKINKIDGYTQSVSSITYSKVSYNYPNFAILYQEDSIRKNGFYVPLDISTFDLDNHNGLIFTVRQPNSQNRWIFVVHKVYKDSDITDAGYLFVGQMYYRNVNYIYTDTYVGQNINRVPVRAEITFIPTDDNRTRIIIHTEFMFLDSLGYNYNDYINWMNYIDTAVPMSNINIQYL